MRKWLFILLLFSLPHVAFTQQEEDPEPPTEQVQEKIRDRMRDYIQVKLGLSKDEMSRFTPVFFRYFREFAQIHRENRLDRLVMQQKIIELRLRFRSEFTPIVGEARANKIFFHEDQFRREALRIIRENRQNGPRRMKGVMRN